MCSSPRQAPTALLVVPVEQRIISTQALVWVMILVPLLQHTRGSLPLITVVRLTSALQHNTSSPREWHPASILPHVSSQASQSMLPLILSTSSPEATDLLVFVLVMV